MKAEVTEGMRFTLKEVMGYLRMKGIPKDMINQIRMSLTYDAVTQSKDIQYDRIYAAVALMLHDTYQYGQQRILRGLRSFDSIVGSVMDDSETWPGLTNRLREETGLVIRSGGDDRLVVEVLTDDEKANYKYGKKDDQGD